MVAVECVVNHRNVLGESPLWSPTNEHLYWVDILKPAVYAFCPATGQTTSYPMHETIGTFCARRATVTGNTGAQWLLALKSGIYAADANFGSLQQLLTTEPHKPHNRPNDGKCDRQGRFWVGTMPEGDRVPSGSLYCIDNTHSARQVLTGLTVPNSLAWSPDGRLMYFTDTPTRRIMAYDFDVDDGVPSNPRVFHAFDSHRGRPDGSTVDADGCLWNAEIHASRIVRYTPDGKIDRTIDLPVSKVTSCAFGGTNLDTLYITTASDGLSDEQKQAQPLAGALFAANVGIKGLLETPARV